MMPLASWLLSHWRHNPDPRRETVASAARALDDLIWRKHRIKLLYCPDPWHFRTISTEEVKRAQRLDMSLGDADYPQLGTHADPTCRHLTSYNFFALIGTRTDRPLPLYTMNTACLYELADAALGDLIASQLLWSDHPARDCAGFDVRVEISNTDDIVLPAVHLGTAWTRQDRRGHGIMRMVSQLHRLTAWLRYGPIPQFATVLPDIGAEKVFGGRDIGAVIETWPTHTLTARVLFYAPDDAVKAAQRVLAGEG